MNTFAQFFFFNGVENNMSAFCCSSKATCSEAIIPHLRIPQTQQEPKKEQQQQIPGQTQEKQQAEVSSLKKVKVVCRDGFLSFYRLRPFVLAHYCHLDWRSLSRNPHAVSLLEDNHDKIYWTWLSENPNAVHLLQAELNRASCNRLNWANLSRNRNAIPLVEANLGKIYWPWLSMNPNAISILKKHPQQIYWFWFLLLTDDLPFLQENFEKIDWQLLSSNPHAIPLLEANPSKIHWSALSLNENAIHLLEANLHKIDWSNFSCNANAIRVLEKNPTKIVWERLSFNRNAIPLLKANLDKISWCNFWRNTNAIELLLSDDIDFDAIKQKYNVNINWSCLCRNTGIFTYDYKKMQHQFLSTFGEELIEHLYHPKNVDKWPGWNL